MQRKITRYVLLLLAVLVAAAASGQTKYYPYDQLNNPTTADLLTYSGIGRSIIVQILNLTPYQITYKQPEPYNVDGVPVASLQNVLDKNRFTKKSFVFAPVGVPEQIPGLPTKYDPSSSDYNDTLENTFTRPYSMVFAWDDRASFVERSSAFWQVEQVPYCAFNPETKQCTPGSGNVTLGLFMSRIAPQVKPAASFFLIAKDVVSLCMQGFKIVTTGSPTAWVKAVLAVKEIATDAAFLAQQIAEDEEGKMYVSAYAIPDASFECYVNNSTAKCQPTTSAHDDAADAGWNYAFAGYPQGELVVLTQVLRGHKAVTDYQSSSPTMGSVPVVMVTVMRATDYMTNYSIVVPRELTSGSRLAHVRLSSDVRANIEQLQSLLDKHSVSGVTALRAVIGARQLDDRERLWRALKALTTGDSLTNAERQALHSLVVDLRHALNENKGKG